MADLKLCKLSGAGFELVTLISVARPPPQARVLFCAFVVGLDQGLASYVRGSDLVHHNEQQVKAVSARECPWLPVGSTGRMKRGQSQSYVPPGPL